MTHHGPSTLSAEERASGIDEAPSSFASERLGGLYAAHCASLTRYAYTLSQSKELAEDAVQDVFAALASDLGVFERRRNPVAFLFRAVRNRVLNANRRVRGRAHLLADHVAEEIALGRVTGNEGESALLQEEVRFWFSTLVEHLPPKRREAFKLVRLYRVTYAEAARLMVVRTSTVATHVIKATKTLAVQLEALGLLDIRVRAAIAPRRIRIGRFGSAAPRLHDCVNVTSNGEVRRAG